ncbi:SDR family NAD(P)-dependent oxidoreductase [Marinobacter sp. SS21]|uniref:SDR family NAD(P)-dependent oxidoreductase n=1 Tax=Marinobacter sp. SS21 TaxID=2979460 RepID=UPI00232E8937|nr:SDR family NAD(P)-dependent oxidoreductase [Marinobacter sp. SS21]MDC0663684.1 SDR family NAD(P)-dependent oxidoreductase [Marinobacter sp. SS21]
MAKAAAVIVGVGDRQGIGASVACLAARHDLHVFIAGRTPAKLDTIVAEIEDEGGAATAVALDSTSADDIERLFAAVDEAGQSPSLVVYNTGRNIPTPFLESQPDDEDGHWRRCVYGAFLVSQQALRRQLARPGSEGHRGTILFTGASASLRGKPMFAGFSAAKAGLRAMAQSMAREFSPQGIHVGHVVIDGMVNGAIVKGLGGGLGKFALGRKGPDGALIPDEVAKQFLMLHEQPRSAWTHELDLRPYKEVF